MFQKYSMLVINWQIFKNIQKSSQDSLIMLTCWVKISADEIFIFSSYFSQKIGFDISSKLSQIPTQFLAKISPIWHLLFWRFRTTEIATNTGVLVGNAALEYVWSDRQD